MTPSYRIEDKEDVRINGHKVTRFKAYEWSGKHAGYVYVGEFSADGWGSSDAKCIAAIEDNE